MGKIGYSPRKSIAGEMVAQCGLAIGVSISTALIAGKNLKALGCAVVPHSVSAAIGSAKTILR